MMGPIGRMGPIRPMSPICPTSPIRRKPPMEPPGFIPPHGGYRALLSYQKAEVIYDLTFRFCQRFLAKGDRTADQMLQAARSGKQNIAEGSKAARTSKETEIKLTNVARASLEELLADYRDFLRVRDLNSGPKTQRKRDLSASSGPGPGPPLKPIANSSRRARPK